MVESDQIVDLFDRVLGKSGITPGRTTGKMPVRTTDAKP
jgi:hypothetical protein